MAKNQAVWAIDIGQAALKALKLSAGDTPDIVLAETFDYIEYPKILSQPDADPEESVHDALQTFLGRNDLKGCRVAIAVPGQAGLVKFIKLPPVEKKRIPDIVKFEARQQIPFALEEVIWDYQQIALPSEDGEEADDDFAMVEVGLFAMKRDQIYRAIQPLKAAGIEVDIVQMSPISLFNFMAFDRMQGQDKPDGSVVLLDVGADNTDLIITDGVRIWQRNVPIGGNHFTRALTKELKLTFAKAEHLKKNATKSQDPRAVFTAMRGVFSDLSSEVSRSIGFYSSVNRQAKISKVLGLGNGFKLPGLQKFLQQNLNYEVERLESFHRLVGEEVTSAPQFSENLMSYAVAYGLGVQGLGTAPLKSNLLPPELEQVRMVRRKKPWALVGAALVMLAFTSLYAGAWNAWSKVVKPEMTTSVERAKSVASRGSTMKSSFESANSAYSAKRTEGEALVAQEALQFGWDDLLKRVVDALPYPTRDLGLDPNASENQEIFAVTRVHIDAILPRYFKDLSTEWFSTPELEGYPKDFMHPYDRLNPPTGEGWVIQIVGHHYNPSPLGPQATKFPESFKRPEINRLILGPWNYLTLVVVPKFITPSMRQFGISHATAVWIDPDDAWVSDKVAQGNPLPPAPILPRPTAASIATMLGSSGGDSSGSDDMMMRTGGYGSMMGSGEGDSASFEEDYAAMMESNAYYGGGAPRPDQEFEKTTLTRTNFMIQFVWQPPDPTTPPPTIEEIVTKLAEAANKEGIPSPITLDQEQAIVAKSQDLVKKSLDEQVSELTAGADQTKPAEGEAPAETPEPPTTPAPPPAP